VGCQTIKNQRKPGSAKKWVKQNVPLFILSLFPIELGTIFLKMPSSMQKLRRLKENNNGKFIVLGK